MKKLISILLCIVLFLSVTACGKNNTNIDADIISSQEENQSPELSITMLNVGQGLSVLLEFQGRYMLYDGGGRKSSSYVVSYLKSHNVSEIDYMIASHYDEDHIAGLIGVLNTTQVNNIICPEYTADTRIYQSFINKVASSNTNVYYAVRGNQFTFGDVAVTVLNPSGYEQIDENNYSVAIRLSYGLFNCVITGDAEKKAEKEMLECGLPLEANLYIAGHHGSASSNSDEFIKAIRPEYAFISCGLGNDYGHPAEQTMEIFKDNNVEIFRTDLQNEVICSTDGESINFSTNPCNDYTPGMK